MEKNMKNQKYEEPKVKIIEFQVEDIIATSSADVEVTTHNAGGGIVLPDDKW